MIEVYWINRRKQEEKLHRFIDGKQFLDKKRKLRAYVEGNVFYWRPDHPAMTLQDDNAIVATETGEALEYLRDFKIYALDNSIRCELSKETGDILDNNGEIRFKLKKKFLYFNPF